MKRFITFLTSMVAIGLIVFNQQAATLSGTIQQGGFSNLLSLVNGSAKVTQFVITSQATNSASIRVYDTPTNSTTYTVAAYTNILTYGTNMTVSWTNYYGVSNGYSGVFVVDVTNTVAAATNPYALRIIAQAPTNASLKFDSVNYYFSEGIWATNVGTGAASWTMTFVQ